MAKFYVQSGDSKMVMSAADAQAAALWLVHCNLKDVMPAYDDPRLNDDDRCEIAVMKGLLKMDTAIIVSERGFDRSDAKRYDTLRIITEWHQLLTALIRFEADQELI